MLLFNVRITWEPEYAGPLIYFHYPPWAHAVAENLGTEGPHTYFSVIRLLLLLRCCAGKLLRVILAIIEVHPGVGLDCTGA